jgi:hypothetical protein
MLHRARNELICDFAETYHIYELGSLPVTTVAILAGGLRETSRTKMKLAGAKVAPDILLLAHAVDALRILIWQPTKDGHKNRNKPASIAEAMLGIDRTEKTQIKTTVFDSPEDFERARREIIERAVRNG